MEGVLFGSREEPHDGISPDTPAESIFHSQANLPITACSSADSMPQRHPEHLQPSMLLGAHSEPTTIQAQALAKACAVFNFPTGELFRRMCSDRSRLGVGGTTAHHVPPPQHSAAVERRRIVHVRAFSGGYGSASSSSRHAWAENTNFEPPSHVPLHNAQAAAAAARRNTLRRSNSLPRVAPSSPHASSLPTCGTRVPPDGSQLQVPAASSLGNGVSVSLTRSGCGGDERVTVSLTAHEQGEGLRTARRQHLARPPLAPAAGVHSSATATSAVVATAAAASAASPRGSLGRLTSAFDDPQDFPQHVSAEAVPGVSLADLASGGTRGRTSLRRGGSSPVSDDDVDDSVMSSLGSLVPLTSELRAWRADSVTDDGGIELEFMVDDVETSGNGSLKLYRMRQALMLGSASHEAAVDHSSGGGGSPTSSTTLLDTSAALLVPGGDGDDASCSTASEQYDLVGTGDEFEHGGEADESDVDADSSVSVAESGSAADAAQQDTLPIHLPLLGHFRLPPLTFVLMVVGTRGDVQPFIGIALQLRRHGHRVRLASHAVYREFVESFGLEFFPLGGDPKVLSEFVVKHRGVNPGFDLKDLREQRQQVRLIINSTYSAATQPDPAHPDKAFRADAIVCNPPSYGHIHVAEKMGVPLHMVFTMPWTPTGAFPQPFARLVGTNSQQRRHSGFTATMNWLSYFAMEDLTWMGLADIIKHFRCEVLGLKGWGTKYTNSHTLYYNQVPFTYIWSPSLVPRPADWRSHIHVSGFIHLDLARLTQYTPPPELATFLAAGDPPLYIGFGSLVMNNPDQLTRYIMQAVDNTGIRAIIQRGWGGLGSGVVGALPPGVLLVDTCAHDWLFPRCAALVHHGGAGTTATGLYAGKPTFIVPFFGDQPFWGWACCEAGVGPPPVSVDHLNADKITEAILVLMRPESRAAAAAMAERMKHEEGAVATVHHIHHSVYSASLGLRAPHYMKLRPAGGSVSGLSSLVPGLSSRQDTAEAAHVGGAREWGVAAAAETAQRLLGPLRLPRHTRLHARRKRKEDRLQLRRNSSSIMFHTAGRDLPLVSSTISPPPSVDELSFRLHPNAKHHLPRFASPQLRPQPLHLQQQQEQQQSKPFHPSPLPERHPSMAALESTAANTRSPLMIKGSTLRRGLFNPLALLNLPRALLSQPLRNTWLMRSATVVCPASPRSSPAPVTDPFASSSPVRDLPPSAPPQHSPTFVPVAISLSPTLSLPAPDALLALAGGGTADRMAGGTDMADSAHAAEALLESSQLRSASDSAATGAAGSASARSGSFSFIGLSGLSSLSSTLWAGQRVLWAGQRMLWGALVASTHMVVRQVHRTPVGLVLRLVVPVSGGGFKADDSSSDDGGSLNHVSTTTAAAAPTVAAAAQGVAGVASVLDRASFSTGGSDSEPSCGATDAMVAHSDAAAAAPEAAPDTAVAHFGATAGGQHDPASAFPQGPTTLSEVTLSQSAGSAGAAMCATCSGANLTRVVLSNSDPLAAAPEREEGEAAGGRPQRGADDPFGSSGDAGTAEHAGVALPTAAMMATAQMMCRAGEPHNYTSSSGIVDGGEGTAACAESGISLDGIASIPTVWLAPAALPPHASPGQAAPLVSHPLADV